MTPSPPEESDLDFVQGGPSFRLQERAGLIEARRIPVRIAVLVALTWVPLLLLSLLQGRALGPTPRESFLLDFVTHGRFLLCVPLLIVAELVVGARLSSAGRFFLSAKLVRPEDRPRFFQAVADLIRWRNSGWVQVALLALALVGSWTINYETWDRVVELTWRAVATPTGERLSWAGLWFHGVALPVFQFLVYLWIWRLALWTRFLHKMSRLDLDLVPTHADAAGGLGFLGTAHSSLGILACALGFPFFGDVAFRLLYEGATPRSFEIPLAAFLLGTAIFLLSPPLVFIPKMARTRRDGLRAFSALVDEHDRAFHRKWMDGVPEPGASPLGVADISSLADLGTGYDRVKKMKSFPLGRGTVARIVGMALLPATPLVFFLWPVREVLKFLAKAIF